MFKMPRKKKLLQANLSLALEFFVHYYGIRYSISKTPAVVFYESYPYKEKMRHPGKHKESLEKLNIYMRNRSYEKEYQEKINDAAWMQIMVDSFCTDKIRKQMLIFYDTCRVISAPENILSSDEEERNESENASTENLIEAMEVNNSSVMPNCQVVDTIAYEVCQNTSHEQHPLEPENAVFDQENMDTENGDESSDIYDQMLQKLLLVSQGNFGHVCAYFYGEGLNRISVEELVNLNTIEKEIDVEIIDFFVALFREGSAQSFFYLSCGSTRTLFTDSAVKDDYYKIELYRIFDDIENQTPLLVCPLLDDQHFILITVNFVEKKMILYDPLYHRGKRLKYELYFQNFYIYLRTKLRKRLPTLKLVFGKCDKQKGTNECGVHLLENIRELSIDGIITQNKIYNYEKLRLEYFKKVIDCGIITGHCIYCPSIQSPENAPLIKCNLCERNYHGDCNSSVVCVFCNSNV